MSSSTLLSAEDFMGKKRFGGTRRDGAYGGASKNVRSFKIIVGLNGT